MFLRTPPPPPTPWAHQESKGFQGNRRGRRGLGHSSLSTAPAPRGSHMSPYCHITFSGPTSCPTDAHRLTTPSNHVTFSQLLLSVLRLSNIQMAPWDRTPAYAGDRDDSQAFFHVVCSPGFLSAHPDRASPLAHEFPPLDPADQSPELTPGICNTGISGLTLPPSPTLTPPIVISSFKMQTGLASLVKHPVKSPTSCH